jgi:hypothetical protein
MGVCREKRERERVLATEECGVGDGERGCQELAYLEIHILGSCCIAWPLICLVGKEFIAADRAS